MRFGNEAPRGAMDYLFIELMKMGPRAGLPVVQPGGWRRWRGLERHPLAPAWHRVGNFVFRYGEHFYNFEGLRRYKTKIRAGSGSRNTLVARGGLALPARARGCLRAHCGRHEGAVRAVTITR